MVNSDKNIAFIHLPKCGGTSIEKLLYAQGFSKMGHFHNRHSFYIDKLPAKNRFVFTFVRNPFSKVVSEYHWFTNNKHRFPHARVKKVYQGLTFNEFLVLFHNCNIGDKMHKLTYHQILNPIDQVDFIGRFEDLQQDFDRLCDMIGMHRSTLPHTNKTDHDHYSTYYDDQSYKYVSDMYSRDIEYFNYTFEYK